jgi:hypothetical protein
MKNIINWKKLSRTMKSLGYTIQAISETLSNMDIFIPERTLYRICKDINKTSETRFTSLSLLDALSLLDPDLRFCQNDTVLRYIYEGENISDTPPQTSAGIFDCTDHDQTADILGEFGQSDEVYVWYPTARSKTGLKSYLDNERRQNRQEENLSYNG